MGSGAAAVRGCTPIWSRGKNGTRFWRPSAGTSGRFELKDRYLPLGGRGGGRGHGGRGGGGGYALVLDEGPEEEAPVVRRHHCWRGCDAPASLSKARTALMPLPPRRAAAGIAAAEPHPPFRLFQLLLACLLSPLQRQAPPRPPRVEEPRRRRSRSRERRRSRSRSRERRRREERDHRSERKQRDGREGRGGHERRDERDGRDRREGREQEQRRRSRSRSRGRQERGRQEHAPRRSRSRSRERGSHRERSRERARR